jgi:hypothetical protein
MVRREALLALVLAPLTTAPAVSAVVWPDSNSDWTAITRSSGGYADSKDGKQDSNLDIRGDTSLSAGYYYLDDDQYLMMFRIRINDAPVSGKGTWVKNVWQVLFDTDGTASTIDWALQLDQATDQQVEFGAVTHAKNDTWVNLTVTDDTWSSSANYRTVATGETRFGTADDYFIDVAIPYQVFANATGLDIGDTFTVGFSTSQQHQNVNKDTPDGQNPNQGPFSNAITFAVAAIPEPGSLILTGTGLVALFFVKRRQVRRKKLRLQSAAARSPPPLSGTG